MKKLSFKLHHIDRHLRFGLKQKGGRNATGIEFLDARYNKSRLRFLDTKRCNNPGVRAIFLNLIFIVVTVLDLYHY